MNHNKDENELYDKCKERLTTPKEKWIKYEGPEQLKKLLLENKKKKGWKFKDDK